MSELDWALVALSATELAAMSGLLFWQARNARTERRELLDRLMARSVSEFYSAQGDAPRTAVRSLTQRMADERRARALDVE